MRAWFHLVARQRSSELFMLNLLLITLGLAALTELAGLSLALGAFLAGMLIAETEYRYQVEEDIKPFRDVLLGLFFVTVGMALDLAVVARNIHWVVLLLVVPVVAKLALIVVLSRVFGASMGTSLRNGFYLAQAGEFALVLLALAVDQRSWCRGRSRRSCSRRWCCRCCRRRCSSISPSRSCAGSPPTTGSPARRRSPRSPRRRWRARIT